MIAMFLLAAPIDAAHSPSKIANVGVDPRPVSAGDMRLPISDSVLAATWDTLRAKPTSPVKVRLACIVFAQSGAPATCVRAGVLPVGQTTVDWTNVMELAERDAGSLSPSENEQLSTATIRATTLRLKRTSKEAGKFDVRMIDITIQPSDARPAFVPGDALRLADLELAEPFDQSLGWEPIQVVEVML